MARPSSKVEDVLPAMSSAELLSHTRRVTSQDLAKVTPEQIQAVLRTASREQLRIAAQAMQDHHRIKDIAERLPPGAFDAALASLTEAQLQDTALGMQHNLAYQAEVIDAMGDEQRERCTQWLAARREGGKPKEQ